MRKQGLLFPLLILMLVMAPGALGMTEAPAQDSPSQDSEVQELRKRVAELENKVSALAQALETFTREREAPAPVKPAQQPPAIAPQPQPIPDAPFSMPPELVPEIGKVGAEVGLLLSGSSNPFQLNRGNFVAGFIDLPLIDWGRGKIAYEILVGMSQSNTTLESTSNVAQVANLAVLSALNPNGGLANVTAAVTGTGPAPFPVKTSASTRLRLLQVVPFSIKYTSTAFDRFRFRPYGVLGFGTYVTIHHQNPGRGTPPTYGIRPDAQVPPEILAAVQSLFGGQAPFGGPLVAGQISQAPELEARGLPGGHGNLDFGLQGGFGFEYRVHRNLSIGFDNRYNKIAGSPGLLITYGSRIGVHF